MIDRFEKLKLIHLSKVRIANPSEWRGVTEENQKVFVRFISGELSVGVGETYVEAQRNSIPVIDFGDDETDFLCTEDLIRYMKWKKTILEPKYSQLDYDS
jgi:hypothetical protein